VNKNFIDKIKKLLIIVLPLKNIAIKISLPLLLFIKLMKGLLNIIENIVP